MEPVLSFLLIWVAVSLGIYLFLLFTQDRRLKAVFNGHKNKYLMITAHPDDECMFFGPLIGTLLKWHNKLRLLCLSSGNYYGVGDVRRQELFQAASALGLASPDQVSLVDDPRMPDSMRENWESDVILEFVGENCRKNANICSRDELSMITFDSVGITRHPNHTSINKALSSKDCLKSRLLTLVSIPFFVQYTGSLTCVPIFLAIMAFRKLVNHRSKRSVYIVVASPRQWLQTIRAMLCHKSQIMWFRVLHLMLSSYLLVNLIEVEENII